MKRTKKEKVALWKIGVGAIALLSGLTVSLSVGLIPASYLYNRPPLSRLLTIAVSSSLFLLGSIIIISNKPWSSLKNIVVPRASLMALLAVIASIGSTIIKRSFQLSLVEGAIIIVAAAAFIGLAIVERRKIKK